MSLVIIEIKDSIGTITLDHDEKRNALSFSLVEEILYGLGALEKKGARVAILRARSGSKVWSAGHNVVDLPPKGKDPLTEEDPLRRLISRIKKADFPVIAMVEGGVFGGANEVVAACDIVIAADNASFRFTPARMGVPYDQVGLLTMINAVGLRTAKEMVFTAKSFDSKWAQEHGLVSRVVSLSSLEEETYEESKNIANNSPIALWAMKYTLNVHEEPQLLSLTSREVREINFRRNAAYSSDDYEEGKCAFFEKRDPLFKGK